MPFASHLLAFLFLPLTCFADASLVVDDPRLLQALEKEGFTFSELAIGPGKTGADNEALYRVAAYRSIVDSLAEDLQALRRTDARLGIGMESSHRLFDARWLRTSAARFELVGIVNRMDRAAFHPATCGETRFIYRLAYRKGSGAHAVYSRLPMTVNVVFLIGNRGSAEHCRAWAQQWQTLEQNLRGRGAAGFAKSGFTRDAFDRGRLKSVEINLQSVRWPSTVRPDMAGYAEYFLRVFKPGDGRFVLATLENTPDAEKIRADPALKKKLHAWLRDPVNFKAVDEGVAQIPAEFLAKRSTSVALHGAHRLANMPFSRIFSEGELAALPYADGRYVRSAHGYLRRLNDLSCAGCHQGRTVAGFHFLGIDRAETDHVNSIAVSASPHFLRDQARRKAHVDAVATGATPVGVRALSVRADQGEGDFGSHCGLGDASFAAWTCGAGLSCQAVSSDNAVSRTGVCLPPTPIAGSACQPATMAHDADPHRDKLVAQTVLSCGAGAVCEDARVGFPGGMCSRGDCRNLKPGEACGSIAILKGFNDCLADKKLFAACLRSNVRPGVLKACSTTEHCRDDFICTRTDSGAGACIPPYFLFQLRVDGHPSPP